VPGAEGEAVADAHHRMVTTPAQPSIAPAREHVLGPHQPAVKRVRARQRHEQHQLPAEVIIQACVRAWRNESFGRAVVITLPDRRRDVARSGTARRWQARAPSALWANAKERVKSPSRAHVREGSRLRKWGAAFMGLSFSRPPSKLRRAKAKNMLKHFG